MNPHRRISRFGFAIWLAAFCTAALAASTLLAEPTEEGILVRGEGAATARPTEIEMSGTLSGEAPLAADALVKFRDAKKRAMAAIAALKNPDLSVEPLGVSVTSGSNDPNAQMMIMRGMTPPNTGQSVRLMETSRIVLTHTDKLQPEELLGKVLKILDVAKDAGFQIGRPPPRNWYEAQQRAQEGDNAGATVSFKLPDSTATREKAYKAAMEDAKAKAQRLAELSGAKLGRIISVYDSAEPRSENSTMIMYFYGSLNNHGNPAEDKSISSTVSGDLVLRANLSVRFEIVK